MQEITLDEIKKIINDSLNPIKKDISDFKQFQNTVQDSMMEIKENTKKDYKKLIDEVE